MMMMNGLELEIFEKNTRAETKFVYQYSGKSFQHSTYYAVLRRECNLVTQNRGAYIIIG